MIDRFIRQINERIAELPDRTSPNDWPEAMLVTADEIESIISDIWHRRAKYWLTDELHERSANI